MKISVFYIILFFSFLSCSESKEGRKDLLKPDYTIKEGASFTISLKSNPSTGYSWQWVNKKLVNIIDTSKLEYHSLNKGLIGSGGEEIWTFKGLKPGIDSIILKYARSWDTSSIVDTKMIIVKVL